MQKLPERSEISVEDTWDLSKAYKSESLWDSDFSKLDSMLDKLMKFKDKLSKGPSTLVLAFQAKDDIERLIEKLHVYAHLLSDQDISNSPNSARLNKILAKSAEISGGISWFEPEILRLPRKTLVAYSKSKKLAFYRRTINELIRFKPHSLSAQEERILALASDSLSTPYQAFSAINNADIRFPEVPDGRGGAVKLSHATYSKLIENKNREIRRQAFDAMYDTFAEYKNVLATTLAGTVKTHVMESRIRKFDSCLSASLHGDNIPVNIYDNLVTTVRDGLPAFSEYLDLRKLVLEIDDLDMFDLHNPLIPKCSKDVPWEEAVKTVADALDILGPEYRRTLHKAFSSRWIDIPESRGKRSGAYSSGCYDSPPYILMNYNSTLNDVFTLAHEIGHSMHSYFSNKTQPYHYAAYSIFVAEVASTTNELILHRHLMESSTDPQFHAYLLNHLANTIRGTLFRQTMFAEYERLIHEQTEQGEPLTPDSLSDTYCKINAEYHKAIATPNSKIMFEWARIPHFYYNFYVYKYATGISAAAALSQGIIKNEKKKIAAYLEFLKAGSTKDALDILADAGVDLASPQPVKDTITLFKSTTRQLKTLMADSASSTVCNMDIIE
ncbi:MAG: oligoendopeptidase F [Victivallales bacterium]|nr:oligoendopeptidase F [Victivallales bacterium]